MSEKTNLDETDVGIKAVKAAMHYVGVEAEKRISREERARKQRQQTQSNPSSNGQLT